MADIFYTILIAWVLWRIFGGSSVKTQVFHHHYSQPKKEGEVKVSGISAPPKKASDNQGEYVDYEEVK
jgi:hypothetical protein